MEQPSRMQLRKALRTICKNAISSKETEYVLAVLGLSSGASISFKQFAVIAALAERIASMDAVVRTCISQMDFEDIQGKLDKAKDIFYINDAEHQVVAGWIVIAHMTATQTAPVC